MKKRELATASDAASAISVVPPSPQMDAAGRINYYHRLSRAAGEVSIKAALAAGLELARIQIGRPGRLFEEWVEANCEFARRTAFRYMAAVRETLGRDGGMARLLEGSDDDRREAVEEYAAKSDSKSLTELYVDLGIVKKTPSNLGGKREGAGRPRKLTLEQMQAQADALAKDPEAAWKELSSLLAPVSAFIDARDGLGILDDLRLEYMDAHLGRWLERTRQILAGRRAPKKGGR